MDLGQDLVQNGLNAELTIHESTLLANSPAADWEALISAGDKTVK